MADIDVLEQDNKEFVRITPQGVQHCLDMINHRAFPSDFGYDFMEAALLLFFFRKTILDGAFPLEIAEEHARITASCDELIALWAGAGHVLGEVKDSE